jgi:hypothetical protein
LVAAQDILREAPLVDQGRSTSYFYSTALCDRFSVALDKWREIFSCAKIPTRVTAKLLIGFRRIAAMRREQKLTIAENYSLSYPGLSGVSINLVSLIFEVL